MSIANDREAAFLLECEAAFARRRKAIHYRVRDFIVRRGTGEADGQGAHLDVQCHPRRLTMLALTIWNDRDVAVSAAPDRLNVPRKWRYGYNGRLIAPSAGALVAGFEQSIAAVTDGDSGSPDRLDAIWRPLLGRGPQVR